MMAYDPTVLTWVRGDVALESLRYGSGDHRTVPVAVNGQAAAIDEPLAEMVYLLWSVGIRTEMACYDVYDDGSDVARLEFSTADDVQYLLTLVEESEPDDDSDQEALLVRMSGLMGASEGWAWEVHLDAEDGHLMVDVTFPMAYVPELVGLLREFVEPGA